MRRITFSLFLNILIFSSLNAQNQGKIPFQGKLYSENEPLNKVVKLDFSMSYQTINWSESHNVKVVDGLFFVVLGEKKPIPPVFYATPNIQLSIGIENEDPIQVPLIATPQARYAFNLAEQTITPLHFMSADPHQVLATDSMGRAVWVDDRTANMILSDSNNINIMGNITLGSGDSSVTRINGVLQLADFQTVSGGETNGMIRFNTQNNQMQIFQNGTWVNVSTNEGQFTTIGEDNQSETQILGALQLTNYTGNTPQEGMVQYDSGYVLIYKNDKWVRSQDAIGNGLTRIDSGSVTALHLGGDLIRDTDLRTQPNARLIVSGAGGLNVQQNTTLGFNTSSITKIGGGLVLGNYQTSNTPQNGTLRYNSLINQVQAFITGNWHDLSNSDSTSILQNGNAFATALVIGTTDNQNITLKTNNNPVMRFINTTGTPNIIGGHEGNRISGQGSFIGGGGKAGLENQITGGDYSFIGGGVQNAVSGSVNFIGGGFQNKIQSLYSVIPGGQNNFIRADANHSFIGGGDGNKILGESSFIGGGVDNRIQSDFGIISGGQYNFISADADYSFIGGGVDNKISGAVSFIGGGVNNQIGTGADYSFAAGTRAKVASGHQGSFVWADNNGGANYLSTTAPQQFIARASGGFKFFTEITNDANQAVFITTGGRMTAPFISTNQIGLIPNPSLAGGSGGEIAFNTGNFYGYSNGQWNRFATVSANSGDNILQGGNAFATALVIGTTDNQNVILKMNNNPVMRFINTTGIPNIIGGYQGNRISGQGSFIGGGGNAGNINQISDHYSFIGGGQGNQITKYGSFIGCGNDNNISGSKSFIGGGEQNRVETLHSAITGGVANTVSGSKSFIGGGQQNTVSSDYGVITGGVVNTVSGSRSFIGGGQQNTVSSNYGVITGGLLNKVSGSKSFIGGGQDNSIKEIYGVIAGGQSNVIFSTATHGFIGGGQDNSIKEIYGVIAGGQNNSIKANADYSFIGGGFANEILSQHGVISGGLLNKVSGRMSFIGGGQNNQIESQYSVIPGGIYNQIGIGADYSFAGGFYAKVASGHRGSFVWADNSVTGGNYLATTAPRQFIARASGGFKFFTESTNDANQAVFINTGGRVGIGMNAPTNKLHVTSAAQTTGTASLGKEHHTVLFENTNSNATQKFGVLALNIENNSATNAHNYITFYQAGVAKGAIEKSGSGIYLNATGADYAEWMYKTDIHEKISATQIVAVVEGKITKNTTNAKELKVISSAPIVLGNWKGKKEEHKMERVAFLGQVPVQVWGVVRAGDLIIPSGKNDGTGIAVAPEKITPKQYVQIVGTAWESSDQTALKRINVAVGQKTPETKIAELMQISKKQSQEIQQLKAQNRKIEELKAQNEELKANYQKMQQQIEQLLKHTQN